MHQWLNFFQQGGMYLCILLVIAWVIYSQLIHLWRLYRSSSASEITAEQISTLKIWISSAPLIGLLGTVSGMQITFKNLSSVNMTDVMSSGISQALLTTEVGLLIAIPALTALTSIQQLIKST